MKVTKAAGYTLSLSPETQQKTIGETAQVALGVTASGYESYAAADLSFQYDAAALQFDQAASVLPEKAEVTDQNGTLRILIHGADKALSAPFQLAFQVKKAGESQVKLTAAKMDVSDQADLRDAPDAAIAQNTATICASNYTVTLSEDFTGENTVAPGATYTFTAKDTHYDYTFTGSTMGGEAVTVTDNGDGTFKIENVSGNLVITASKTAKTYQVTVDGSGKDDVTAAGTATYLTDYTFSVAQDDKYTYDVSATAGGAACGLTLAEGKYTIAGANVTGDIVITVTKEEKPVTTTQITFEGEGSADVKGGTTQSADNGRDFQFELDKKDGYTYTVKLDGEALSAGADGKYTIPGSKLTGTALTVTVEKTASITVDVSQYVKLQDAKVMYLVTVSGTPEQGKTFAYNGTAMFYSEKYSAYAYLVISDKTLPQMQEAAPALVSQAAAASETVTYDFDVNGTGAVDVNDAQLVYNMYNAKYGSFDSVSMLHFLRADLNGSKNLTVEDSAAIVNHILGK